VMRSARTSWRQPDQGRSARRPPPCARRTQCCDLRLPDGAASTWPGRCGAGARCRSSSFAVATERGGRSGTSTWGGRLLTKARRPPRSCSRVCARGGLSFFLVIRRSAETPGERPSASEDLRSTSRTVACGRAGRGRYTSRRSVRPDGRACAPTRHAHDPPQSCGGVGPATPTATNTCGTWPTFPRQARAPTTGAAAHVINDPGRATPRRAGVFSAPLRRSPDS